MRGSRGGQCLTAAHTCTPTTSHAGQPTQEVCVCVFVCVCGMGVGVNMKCY